MSAKKIGSFLNLILPLVDQERENPFYERYSSYASQTSWDCLHVSKTLAIRKRYACPSIRYHQIQAALETRKCILVDKAKASTKEIEVDPDFRPQTDWGFLQSQRGTGNSIWQRQENMGEGEFEKKVSVPPARRGHLLCLGPLEEFCLLWDRSFNYLP